MMMTTEEAARAGASAGLLGEAARRGMARLPGATQAAFAEAYVKGRHCRRVAEGNERAASGEAAIPDLTMTREQLAAEFQRRPDLRREFSSEASFVAYAQAERSGKLRRTTGRVVYV